MTSLITNSAAMTALQTLQSTNKMLEATQQRISTGYRVGSAKDNAAYWSIATTMRSDNSALSAVKDSLGIGAAQTDVAYTGINSTVSVLDDMKAKLVAALQPGVDKSKIGTEFKELQNQLRNNASAASFNGENWLQVDSTTATPVLSKKIISSFDRSDEGIKISTIDVDTSKIYLFDKNPAAANDARGILGSYRGTDGVVDGALTPATAIVVASADGAAGTEITLTNASTVAEITGYLNAVEAALQDVTTSAANVGSAKSRIELQQSFVGNLMDALDRGIGTLVDADMTEESTKLKALQTQQQLGVQALSIANSSSQSILQLFQN